MRIIDPGHRYELTSIDGPLHQLIVFVKRVGFRYPGNKEPAHAGTNCQEMLRVVFDRLRYLNKQIPCIETAMAMDQVKAAIALMEIRAKRVNGKYLDTIDPIEIVFLPTCRICGHVECTEEHHNA